MRLKSLIFPLLLAANSCFAQQTPNADDVFRIPKVVNYEVGVTTADSLVKYWSQLETHEYKGQVPCENWRRWRTPSFYYSAELVKNPGANLSSDWVRQCQAAFLPGYRTLVTSSHGYNNCVLKNVEMVFENDVLMRYTADVDTNFYRAVYRCNGLATRVVVKKDSIPDPNGAKEKMVLKKTQYVWRIGALKAEVVVADTLNVQHKKYTTAIYTVMDSVKNAVYLKKIAQQKDAFTKEYAAKSAKAN